MCDWFLPGYLAGGPIQSIASLTKHLQDDIEFKIITSDRDFKTNKPYSNVKLNEWTVFEGRSVFYVSSENMNSRFILNLIKHTSHDTLYLNSLFSVFFTIYPLIWKRQNKITSKIVIAPRGMLRNNALSIKPIKKKLFITIAKVIGLFKNVHWQSTSAEETAEIKTKIGNTISISEVSNLPSFINQHIEYIEKKENILKLVYIGRIVGVKNLNFAIDILKEVKNCDIIFDIYGPKEDMTYWDKCQSNSTLLPNNIHFKYKSILNPNEISSTIQRYHALFLPTKTENFGHIIAETLQNSRLVIISDQTPWKNLKNNHVGIDINLKNKEQFVNSIEQFAKLNQTEFDKMIQNCQTFINEKINIEHIKQDYLKLF